MVFGWCNWVLNDTHKSLVFYFKLAMIIENNSDDNKKRKYEAKSKKLANVSIYAGMGFQMIAIIGSFTFAGYKIDQKSAAKLPIYTAIFSLAGVFASLYLIIRSLKKLDK